MLSCGTVALRRASLRRKAFMSTLPELMTDDHRRCDDGFVAVEQAVAAAAWDVAIKAFAGFEQAMQRHFSAEESILFPAFEQRTGMRMGPTQVMRAEHAQMRQLLAAAAESLAAHDADDYSGNAETLLIMMQQHNMKEENVLYPMCAQHLGGAPELLEQLRRAIAG
jgi:hemerythrin-like domain-containing protein